jgi:RNA 2',3'-cyclic 3'-phosphodiesterase
METLCYKEGFAIMHRLFVAARPPAPIREQLLDLMEGVPGARWQDDEQLHITLRFIGEVDARVADDVAGALGTVRHPSFEIALEGIGKFGSRGRVNAAWAGVRPHDQLARLHRKIDHALIRTGLAPERRAYLPHITLARFGREVGGLDGFLARHAALTSGPFAVSDFGLYESRLSQAGATYELVERYSLDSNLA